MSDDFASRPRESAGLRVSYVEKAEMNIDTYPVRDFSHLAPNPDIIRDFSRLQATINSFCKSNVALAQDNARLRDALLFIANSPHCLSIFDARSRASLALEG
jgi:hypothetical protein